MVLGAACYLAAFTATAACEDAAGAGCSRAAWHHVTAAAELLLLAAGLRIAYAARNANVPFQVLYYILKEQRKEERVFIDTEPLAYNSQTNYNSLTVIMLIKGKKGKIRK